MSEYDYIDDICGGDFENYDERWLNERHDCSFVALASDVFPERDPRDRATVAGLRTGVPLPEGLAGFDLPCGRRTLYGVDTRPNVLPSSALPWELPRGEYLTYARSFLNGVNS